MKEQSIRRVSNWLLVVIVLGMLTPLMVSAAQDTDARIEKLERAVRDLQAELNALKAERAREARRAPAVDRKQLEALVSKTFEDKKGEYGVAPKWVQNITPFGDFRYRYESLQGDDSTSSNLTNDRRRNRIRARLGAKVRINDEWDTIFRIASGSSDGPTSTNQTVDGAFESKDLWLDLAYFDWHPEAASGFSVLGGKMKNPFYRVGKNQLIWDSDVNPEGGAVKYSWDLDDATKATLVGGAYWLNERESDADAGYFGIQAMLKHKLYDGGHLVGGVSYYDIGNIDSKSALSADTGVTLNGNTNASTPPAATYRYDYDIVEGFLEYGFECAGLP
ncbi:MAG: putative porin, partial [Planctomycetota bacterium]